MKSSYEKPDFWSQKAKTEGYPARSVYKLAEIDEKFHLLKAGGRFLDIGAAPGSWSLWILRRLGGKGFLAAVDLQGLGPELAQAPSFGNFRFIRGDLYAEEVRSELIGLGPYDGVFSDAAPSTTGNRIVDQGASEAIVESVLAWSYDCLAPGGSLVAKIFQGGAERSLMDGLRQRFAAVRGFKPKACRAESFETYLVETGFRG